MPPSFPAYTQESWSAFFHRLNIVSAENVDKEGCVCRKAGTGWRIAIKSCLDQENSRLGVRAQWSYEVPLKATYDDRERLNFLFLIWNAVPSETKDDPASVLMKVKGLLDAGAITEQEYDQKKAEILQKM